MRKNKKELWTNLYIWAVICSFLGIIIGFIVLILISAIFYAITDVINSFTVFSIISISTGSFFGGYFCGLFRRNNGLYEGIFCGFVIYIILLIIGCVYFHSFEFLISIKKFIFCIIPSAIGGITGVNHKRPRKI